MAYDPGSRGDAATAFRWGWGFFILAAVIGTLLRLAPAIADFPFDSAHLLHAHSHVAMLGWVYDAFFALALTRFVAPADRATYRRLFWITQLATIGMLLTFPWQGYGAASISFSALHLGCAACFGWRIMRRVETNPALRHALGWAFGFMFLSAAGPLSLGPLAAAGLRGTAWYSFAIYFYLHFQYNGWFVFFLLAILLRPAAELTGQARRAIQALALGCLATLALSALWMNPPAWVVGIAVAGAGLQLAAVARLQGLIRPPASFISPSARFCYRVGLTAGLLKFALQLLAPWPGLVGIAVLRTSVIGFLHLIFLGAITPLLIAGALEQGWLAWRGPARVGVGLLLGGALLTELVLFAPAVVAGLGAAAAWPHYNAVLAAAASLMLGGIGLAGFSIGRERWRTGDP